MLRSFFLAIVALGIFSCQKETIETKKSPFDPISEVDSVYFIYGLGNMKTTQLPGYPKKSHLKTHDLYPNSPHITYDFDKILVDLDGKSGTDLIIWQEYKFHGHGESPAKQGQSREVSMYGLNGIKFGVDSVDPVFSSHYFILSEVYPGDTINIKPSRTTDSIRVFYCGSSVGLSIPGSCEPFHSSDAWEKGEVGNFICWNSTDSERTAYLISLQSPTVDTLIVHAIKELEFNSQHQHISLDILLIILLTFAANL